MKVQNIGISQSEQEDINQGKDIDEDNEDDDQINRLDNKYLDPESQNKGENRSKYYKMSSRIYKIKFSDGLNTLEAIEY